MLEILPPMNWSQISKEIPSLLVIISHREWDSREGRIGEKGGGFQISVILLDQEDPGVARGLVKGTHSQPPGCPVGTSKDGNAGIKFVHSKSRRSGMQQHQHAILA